MHVKEYYRPAMCDKYHVGKMWALSSHVSLTLIDYWFIWYSSMGVWGDALHSARSVSYMYMEVCDMSFRLVIVFSEHVYVTFLSVNTSN